MLSQGHYMFSDYAELQTKDHYNVVSPFFALS